MLLSSVTLSLLFKECHLTTANKITRINYSGPLFGKYGEWTNQQTENKTPTSHLANTVGTMNFLILTRTGSLSYVKSCL